MKIALVILAAGFSKRMGVLKPLLPIGARSALWRAVNLGKTEKVHLISVVTGHHREKVEAELNKYGSKNVRHIYNPNFAEGMFSSVKAGINSLPRDIDGFLLLPADHCAVKSETIKNLVAAFLLAEGRAVIYPTAGGKRGHPPLIPYSFTAGIKHYDGCGGMRGFLSQFPFKEIAVDDAGVYMDMDTPSDYSALLAHLGLPNYLDKYTCNVLMKKYEMPENIARHSRLVKKLALKAADLLTEKGVSINIDLLASACLLHDIARLKPDHAEAGFKLLLKEGWPETAMLVAKHMDLPVDYKPAADELSLLYLSDKLARRDSPVPLKDTLSSLEKRFSGNLEALKNAKERIAWAQSISALLSRQYGIEADDLVEGD